jgi:thioredoxin reductase
MADDRQASSGAIRVNDSRATQILIIGAGPYGLALAADLKRRGLDFLLVGSQMSFWREQMPKGMFLRSDWEWHYDTAGILTIDAFLDERKMTRDDITPFPLDIYLDYVGWFTERSKVEAEPFVVQRLDRDEESGRFVAIDPNGRSITARNVVIAIGVSKFSLVPKGVKEIFPAGRTAHTAEFVDFSGAAGMRILIIGGRQSSFEWAALLAEAGAAEVVISHRHPSPAFALADWTWITRQANEIADDPSRWRRITPAEREDITHRMWAEGRLKIEPWLEDRIHGNAVRVLPETHVVGSYEEEAGLRVKFDTGEECVVDQVVFATGYKPDLRRITFLGEGNLLPSIRQADAFPQLDESFQTSVPGLFATSMLAARDFGPYFGFTVAVRSSAQVIGDALSRQ